MFRGVANLSLDAKGRMAIPARYRERLRESCAGRMIVTIDQDGCLLIYPLPEWERIEQALMNQPNMDPRVRRLQRQLVGHAHDVEMDGHGRILVPAALREYAGIEKQAVLVGQGRKFELWDEVRWNEERDAWRAEDEHGDPAAALESLSL
ncbi:MAG: transcriptional regulator MraZ [Gammaproteobacteria bacterium]|nr:MAG: transcriptional regulator MraZ [Gammaproteobacteria bacterium]